MATNVFEMSHITLIQLAHTIWDTLGTFWVDFGAPGSERVLQIWLVGTKLTNVKQGTAEQWQKCVKSPSYSWKTPYETL